MRPYDLTQVWSALSGRVYFWPALIGLAGTLVTTQAQKTSAKTQARIAELQLQTEQKSIDAQVTASKLERDKRVSEQATIQQAQETKAAAAAKNTEKFLSYIPYALGALVIILLAPLLLRKRK